MLVHLRNFGYQANKGKQTKNYPLKPTDVIKKEKPGSCDSAFITSETILIVKWSDNMCVGIGTNSDATELIQKVKRRMSEIRLKREVSQPNDLKSCSTHMRDADHHCLAVKYATTLRGKK